MALTVIIYLLSQCVQALPVSTINLRDGSFHDTSDSRNIWDIIWSCLAVVFLCTWVSLHPDVPPPGQSKLEAYTRRAFMVIAMLIAPEVAIGTAANDYNAARKNIERYKEYNWTLTHGFFAEMGGFVLYDGDSPPRSLHPSNLGPYLQSGEICVTAEEIQDKSKGDALGKTFVLFQTTWFILQLIARGVQGLPIAELEVATLSYAMLNFLIYGLWWNKPLIVDCPIPVYKGISMARFSAKKKVPALGHSENKGSAIPNAFMRAVILDYTEWLADNSHSPEVGTERDWQKGKINTTQSNENSMNSNPTDEGKGGTFAKIRNIALGLFETNFTVPPFIAGTIFGAVHCIAWFYQFPTPAEKMIWHTCSVFITASLPIWGLLLVVPCFPGSWRRGLSKFLGFAIGIPYALARLTLLVLAFTTLRSLPPGALAAVQWTTYMPHI